MDFILTGLGVIVPFLAVLSMVIFFHELGHWGVARLCGVAVEKFSVGFGRALWTRKDKTGTQWCLAWLPLGGYVKFVGDMDATSTTQAKNLATLPETEQRKLFALKPLWVRSAVVAAGPLANFLLAIVLLMGLMMIRGQAIYEPVLGDIMPQSAAAEAGLQSGDRVLAVDDTPIDNFLDLAQLVRRQPDVLLRFEILRNNQQLTLDVRPRLVEEVDRFGNRYMQGQLGVHHSGQNAHIYRKPLGIFAALGSSIAQTGYVIGLSLEMVWHILIGRQSTDGVGGPILIAQLSGETATQGLETFLEFIALISISIGLINLFPIPGSGWGAFVVLCL